jgi:hypothetical protein
MLVRLSIWSDMASKLCGTRTIAVELFVVAFGGGLPLSLLSLLSLLSRLSLLSLLDIDCKASIVADCGELLSLRMLDCGRRSDGRTLKFSRGVAVDVGVAERLDSFSGDFAVSLDSSSSFLSGDGGR